MGYRRYGLLILAIAGLLEKEVFDRCLNRVFSYTVSAAAARHETTICLGAVMDGPLLRQTLVCCLRRRRRN